MKALVLCACILTLASFSSAAIKQQLRHAMNVRHDSSKRDSNICMEQHNMNLDDWYTEEEISRNHHTKSGNEERSRKLGCVFECNFKRKGLMEGTNFIEENVHNSIDENISDPNIRPYAHQIATNCMKEVKDITEECEKGLAAYVCVMKAIHEMADHDEHVVRDTSSQSSQEDGRTR